MLPSVWADYGEKEGAPAYYKIWELSPRWAERAKGSGTASLRIERLRMACAPTWPSAPLEVRAMPEFGERGPWLETDGS